MKAKSSNHSTERFLYSGECFGPCGFLVDPTLLMIRAIIDRTAKLNFVQGFIQYL